MVADVLIRRLLQTTQHLLVLLCLGLAGTAHALTAPPHWVVNGIHADQVSVIAPTRDNTDFSWLRMFRLSDPMATGFECCWHPANMDGKSIWSQKNKSEVELTTTYRLTPSHGAPDQPFVGISVADGEAFVRRTGPMSFEVKWKHRTHTLKVLHCITREGVRIQIEHAEGMQTYYIPLDMDVEPSRQHSCPPNR